MRPDRIYRPTPTEKVQRSFKKSKKRGTKFAAFLMATGGGLVGFVYGVGSGLKEITSDLLPEDEDDDEEEEAGECPAGAEGRTLGPAAPANGQPVPSFLQPPSRS